MKTRRPPSGRARARHRPEHRSRFRLAVAAGLVLVLASTSCDTSINGQIGPNTPITSGTIGGLGFTVVEGTLFQPDPDGPVFAELQGGVIVFDEPPEGLGMSEPGILQIRTEFALANGGSLEVAAFGPSDDLVDGGLALRLSRSAGNMSYDFRLSGASFASGTFDPPPANPDGAQWLVAEFYAENVPGYGSDRSGITAWNLNDTEPAFNTDLLSCDPGPAMQEVALGEDRVGYRLVAALLISVEVVDPVIGPCG